MIKTPPIRSSDRFRIGLLLLACALMTWPVCIGVAQSQDYINGNVAAELIAMGKRIDRVESLLTFAAGALIANFVATMVSIWREPRKRG
jgi:hypothetical protein